MPVPIPHQKQNSFKDIDFQHFFKHYTNLLWRWKWWIILLSPPLAGGGFLGYLKFAHPMHPELTAKVMIGLDNSPVPMATVEVQNIGEGKADLITTRTFLREVVQRLSLRLFIKKHYREQIFDSVMIAPEVKSGKFYFKVNTVTGDDFTITFTNKKLGYSNVILTKGKLQGLSEVTLPGIYMKFAKAFLDNPHNVVMDVVNLEEAIESLLKNLEVINPNPMMQVFNITVRLKGGDYTLIANTANAIADYFVEKNLNFKRRRTVSMLEVLRKDYDKARTEMNNAEANLRSFRTENPTVGVSRGAEGALSSLNEMENNTNALRQSVTEARQLSDRYAHAAGKDDQVQVANEIIAYLQSKNNTSAGVLFSELARLLAEKSEYLQQYGKSHPRILENQNHIDRIVSKTLSELSLFIKRTEDAVKDKAAKASSLGKELQRLPSKELQYSELQRKMQIASDIYTTALNRYNQVKETGTMEAEDVYVMDYAVPPIPPPVKMINIAGVALAIFLIVALAPMLLFDFLDKSVRTETELRRMTNLVILESIPKIVPIKSNKKKDVE